MDSVYLSYCAINPWLFSVIQFVMFGGSVGGMIYLHYNYSYPVMNVTQEVSKYVKI